MEGRSMELGLRAGDYENEYGHSGDDAVKF